MDNGLLRQGELDAVRTALNDHMDNSLHVLDASAEFLAALKGVQEPEQKRRAIGETFIRVFEAFARKQENIAFLMQGTIYPDVIESADRRCRRRSAAQVIKSQAP